MKEKYRQELEEKYKAKISVNPKLDRQMVSFQANKGRPFFRWFKYKEGFSAPLVNYLIDQTPNHRKEILLDPFAGSGAALFCAREKGLKAIGIEILPVGIFSIKSRLNAEKIGIDDFTEILKKIKHIDFLEYEKKSTHRFNHLNITRGAFPEETEKYINGFLEYCSKEVENAVIKDLLLFSLFSILESISYTRKDGQYLRWDERSSKNGGRGKNKFNKGKILTFKEALGEKLAELVFDISIMRGEAEKKEKLVLYEESALYKLPELEDNSLDIVVTSPPYCNRYDYTRTYALELAFFGIDEEKVKELRQSLLTSTVENREKLAQLENFYAKINRKPDFDKIYDAFISQKALAEIVSVLEEYRLQKKLNNPNIVRMVKNYFFEMCFVIYELFRILKQEGIVYMVNDNVRYAGEVIPVDLILSDIARSAGFDVDKIWILSNGKGNSSQQMGNHGREELRKCLYVWKK
jgi:DNA modification methylase